MPRTDALSSTFRVRRVYIACRRGGKKLLMLLLALAALAGAGTGLLSPQPANAACPTYCCPGAPNVCFTCCRPWQCGPNCP